MGGISEFCVGAWAATKLSPETKGRFRKRVVLANVPSFRFSFQGTFGKHTLVPVLVPEEHLANVPLFQFSFRGNIRQNHPFTKPPFCEPPKLGRRFGYFCIFSLFEAGKTVESSEQVGGGWFLLRIERWWVIRGRGAGGRSGVSGSFPWGRCRQGRSEIPHSRRNLQSLPDNSRRMREKRRKTKKSKAKRKRRKTKQMGKLRPSAPSPGDDLRSSLRFVYAV